MKRFLREPLIHFLLLGAVLFGLYNALNQDRGSSSDTVVVSAGRIESLSANFAKVWQRPPTADELKGLIDEYVKEEILSREAVTLGLDRDDPVIRGRLQQKMEFLVEDFAAVSEPTDAELADYLANHPEDFREEARFSFSHVYLNPEKHAEQLEADAAALLDQLKHADQPVDVAGLGDRILLPQEYTQETRSAVAAQFGELFAEALDTLPPGQWVGPIESGYGVHLVLLANRVDSRMPALDEVRSRVKRQFSYARREEANRQFMDKLIENYEVIIQWPDTESSASPHEQSTAMN